MLLHINQVEENNHSSRVDTTQKHFKYGYNQPDNPIQATLYLLYLSISLLCKFSLVSQFSFTGYISPPHPDISSSMKLSSVCKQFGKGRHKDALVDMERVCTGCTILGVDHCIPKMILNYTMCFHL